MRKLFNIAALLTMLAACVSCSDSFENSKAVRFSAKTGNPGTKVSYSGVKESNKERVDWTEGDMIWIWSPESDIPVSHESYYVLRDINPNGFYSEAGNVELYSTEGTVRGLQWNDDVDLQHFFAVYPTPLQNRSVFFRMAMNAGQWDANCSAWYGATIPETQAPTSISSTEAGVVAEPNMNNLIMEAQDACEPNTLVHLDFNPVVTAVEFVVMNGYADQTAMSLKSIKLSAESDPIVGTFTNYLTGSRQTLFEDTSTDVEIPFDPPVTIAYNQTFKFTVFMLGLEDSDDPDIDNVTIEFVTGADANTSNSIKALLKTTQGVMAFPRGKKSYVTGLLIPGPLVWTISAVPDTITAWDSEDYSVEVEEDNS